MAQNCPPKISAKVQTTMASTATIDDTETIGVVEETITVKTLTVGRKSMTRQFLKQVPDDHQILDEDHELLSGINLWGIVKAFKDRYHDGDWLIYSHDGNLYRARLSHYRLGGGDTDRWGHWIAIEQDVLIWQRKILEILNGRSADESGAGVLPLIEASTGMQAQLSDEEVENCTVTDLIAMVRGSIVSIENEIEILKQKEQRFRAFESQIALLPQLFLA
jgi:hypothetical protein